MLIFILYCLIAVIFYWHYNAFNPYNIKRTKYDAFYEKDLRNDDFYIMLWISTILWPLHLILMVFLGIAKTMIKVLDKIFKRN